MKVSIRRFHSPDVRDLETWIPPDLESFGVLVQVLVGPEGEEGEESFDFLLCTPSWLMQHYGREAVIFGRHRVLVFEYNFKLVRKRVSKIVENKVYADWEDFAEKFSRFARWEFEDYAEYSAE